MTHLEFYLLTAALASGLLLLGRTLSERL